MADHVPYDAHHPIAPLGDGVPTFEDVHNHYPAEPGITNRVQDVNMRSLANEPPNDRDYDDPYPGGSTKLPILPYG